MSGIRDPQIEALLDELSPSVNEAPNWHAVLADASSGSLRPKPSTGRPQPSARRTLLLAAIVVALAVLLPLTAVAVTQGWWFFRSGSAPRPISGVLVAAHGRWNGKAWTLSVYRSAMDGICFAITPGGADNVRGAGAAMSCTPFAGTPASIGRSPREPAIAYLLSGGGALGPYITGPVVPAGTEVKVSVKNGPTISVPTTPAPAALGANVRFYATQLPHGADVTAVEALDNHGSIVGRLAVHQSAAINAAAYDSVSNHGRLVILPSWLKRELRAAHRSTAIYLLGTRGGLNFYRSGGSLISRGVPHVCYGVGKAIRPAAIPHGRRYLGLLMGSIGCEPKSPTSFPSLEQLLWDLSIYGADRHHPQMHLERLRGIASDAVRSIALVDAHHHVIRRVPVVDNLYWLRRIPPGVVWVEPSDRYEHPLAICHAGAGALTSGNYLAGRC